MKALAQKLLKLLSGNDPDGRTHARTHARTDGRTDGRTDPAITIGDSPSAVP